MNRFAPTTDREAKRDGGSMALSPNRRSVTMRPAKPPRPTIRVTSTQRFRPEPLVRLVSPAPSPPSPTVERTAPPTSTRAWLVGESLGIHTAPTASAPAATGRSIRKVVRQDP